MLQLHDFSDLVLDEGVAEPDRQALVEDLQRHPRRAQCPVSVPVSVPCFSAPFQCLFQCLFALFQDPHNAQGSRRLEAKPAASRCEPPPDGFDTQHVVRSDQKRWHGGAAGRAAGRAASSLQCRRSSLQCRTAHHGDGANQKRHGMQVDWTGLIISLVAGSSHHGTHAPSRSRRDSHRATKEMACRWIRQG